MESLHICISTNIPKLHFKISSFYVFHQWCFVSDQWKSFIISKGENQQPFKSNGAMCHWTNHWWKCGLHDWRSPLSICWGNICIKLLKVSNWRQFKVLFENQNFLTRNCWHLYSTVITYLWQASPTWSFIAVHYS